MSWISGLPSVKVWFGHQQETLVHTIVMVNEKGGTDAEALHKMLKKLTKTLWPDVSDTPGKRVIIKIDGGPGRLNVEMLADLRLLGVYLFPGIQNTTHATQETDQNYGEFKSQIRAIIRQLLQEKITNQRTRESTHAPKSICSLNRSDLPVIINGRPATNDLPQIPSPFLNAFSHTQNVNAWKICGAVPLTRSVLETNKTIRDEITENDAPSTFVYNEGDDVDIASLSLRDLQEFNLQATRKMFVYGLNGNIFRKQVRKQSMNVLTRLDEYNSTAEERVKRLTKKGISLTNIFHTIGPSSISTDEIFQSFEFQKRIDDYKIKMTKWKEDNSKYNVQQNAIKIVNKCVDKFVTDTKRFEDDGFSAVQRIRDSYYTLTVADLKLALKWKLGIETYKQEVEIAQSERKKVLETMWKRIETSPCPGPIVFDEDMMPTNPSFEASRNNLNTLINKYNFNPTPNEIRAILK